MSCKQVKISTKNLAKPYEEYFEKFNQLYNQHIEKFQAFEMDY